MLEEKYSNHDKGIEGWEMQAEYVHILRQQCLDLWRLQEQASEKAGQAVWVEADARRETLLKRGW